MAADHRPPSDPQKPAPRRLVGFVALAVAIAVAAIGIITRHHSNASLEQWTATQAIPSVTVVTAQAGTHQQELVLPGDVEAYEEAPIYARVSGYVKTWSQDIGAHVKAGQVLAEIDTPDLDQQFAQAKADLAIARANAALADLTMQRWKALRESDSVSQQTSDEKTGDANAKKASVAAAEANVQRLQALENFKHVTAPFDGIVTARKTDIGALINAGSGSGPELFSVADMHQMRVYVRIPQALAAGLTPGMTAELKLPQYPDRLFDATLTTTSHAVNHDSRSLLVELSVDNADGKLWSGTYAEVHFQLPDNAGILHVPTSTLLFRKNGMEVATIGADDKVVLKKVDIGRDLGTTVEIVAGLLPTDKIIDNPPDSIGAGDVVKIAPPKPDVATPEDKQ